MKRIAVIGAGYLGQHHVRILSELQDVELVGVVDHDIDRASHIASLYRIRPYREMKDVLPYVDAVSIVTPTVTHFELCKEAILAGKDVFVEKPITKSLDEAKELVVLAKEKGRLLQVGHLERYNPAYQKAREFIKNPLYIIGERLSPFTGRGIDVEITFDLMIHDIDIIIDILRDKRLNSLSAYGCSIVTEKIDFASARFHFRGKDGRDSLVDIFASRISNQKKRSYTVFCEDYLLLIDFMAQTLQIGIPKNGSFIYEDIPVEKKEPLKEELRDFVECINSRRCPLVSGEDVLYPLSVAIDVTNKILGLG